MAADGIPMEVCLVAADDFGVNPSTFVPGLTQVPNGWISSIGYQTQGYALIPVY
jgi:intracellular sulfur oxidation DsrE/DsrF family protein